MPDEKAGLVGLAALTAILATMPYRVEGRWFYNRDIALDGYHFAGCRFDNCTLRTTKGSFVIENCYFSSCTVVYNAEATKVVRLYNLFSTEAFNEALNRWPSLLPIISQDGTVTIR